MRDSGWINCADCGKAAYASITLGVCDTCMEKPENAPQFAYTILYDIEGPIINSSTVCGTNQILAINDCGVAAMMDVPCSCNLCKGGRIN